MFRPLLLVALVFLTPAVLAQTPTELDGRDEGGMHELYAAYWTNEPGWNSELQIRNNSTKGAIEVSPILRLHDGRSIPLLSVRVKPSTVETINIGQALKALSPEVAGNLRMHDLLWAKCEQDQCRSNEYRTGFFRRCHDSGHRRL